MTPTNCRYGARAAGCVDSLVVEALTNRTPQWSQTDIGFKGRTALSREAVVLHGDGTLRRR